jgi:hypothetical protein
VSVRKDCDYLHRQLQHGGHFQLPLRTSSLQSDPEISSGRPSLSHNIDLRVLHVAGKRNTVADAISRQNFVSTKLLAPGLAINPFEPPQDALGALKK